MMHYGEVELDVIELGAQAIVLDRLRNSVKWTEEHNAKLRATMVNSILELAGQRFQPVEVSCPADWKQSFKERWFPRWALNRWPVVMTTHRVEPNVVYPLIALPNEPRWEWADVRIETK